MVRQQCEANEKDKGKEKKGQSGGSGGQSSFNRHPKHPHLQSHSRGPVNPRLSRSGSFAESRIDRRSVRSATGGATDVAGRATCPQSAIGARLQLRLLHLFHLP